MATLFCADLHLGHKNIHKYRGFTSIEEHDEFVKERWHRQVRKKDKVYILGDVCFTAEHWAEFSTWTGNKVVVLGNHCTERNSSADIPASIDLHGAIRYKEFWLTHIPIHREELRGKLNLHGHTHNKAINDTRYLGVSLEQTGYMLLSLEDIRSEMQRRRSFKYNRSQFGILEATRAYIRQKTQR